MKYISAVRLLPLIAVMAALVSGCKYSDKYELVNAGKFSIEVPSWMDKQEDLRAGAPFQYANRFRNFYAIAEVAPKDSAFANVVGATAQVIKNYVKNAVVSDSAEVTINGFKGVRMEIFGKMDDEAIYYSEVLVDGPAGYYHLSVWTRGEDRKLRYKADIDKIINSLKPL